MWFAALVCGCYTAMAAQYAHTMTQVSVGDGGEPVGFPIAAVVSGLFSLAFSAFGAWKNATPPDASPTSGLLSLLLQSLLKMAGVRLTSEEHAQVIKWLVDGLAIANGVLTSLLSSPSLQQRQ